MSYVVALLAIFGILATSAYAIASGHTKRHLTRRETRFSVLPGKSSIFDTGDDNDSTSASKEQTNQMDEHAQYRKQQSTSSAFPIDFVYCWAGEALQHDGDGMSSSGSVIGDHNVGQGFGEIRWSLKYLEANAPWFHRVYVLVNTPADRPRWLTEASEDRVVMVDRCRLFDNFQDCPTENTQACQAVMHRIPGLAEHFIAMQDDFLVLNPTRPSDFFTDDGKPLVFPRNAENEVALYLAMPHGPNMPPASHPTRMAEFHHLPIPLRLSFAQKMEQTYQDWYAFVRSHHTRFVCCDASVVGNGLDEEFLRIYPHMLLKQGVGSQRTVSYWATCTDPDLTMWDVPGHKQQEFRDCTTQKIKSKGIQFMVIQNIRDPDTWAMVEDAMREHLKDLQGSSWSSQIVSADFLEGKVVSILRSRYPNNPNYISFER